jgi:hypothetical protein
MRNNKGLSWALSALLAGLAHAALAGCATSKPALAEAAAPLREPSQKRWFSGPDGMHVEVVDFADDTSLVQVLGVESELTGKVLAYQRGLNGERVEYRTKLHGGDWYTLTKERDGHWHTYVPGSRDGYALVYAEDKSPQVDATALQRTHQAQSKSGELDALQRFDRAAEQKHNEESLAEASASTAQHCGKAVPVVVVWPSVSDADLLEKSVSGYCGSALSALDHLCEDDAGKRFVHDQVASIECSLNGSNTLQRSGQKLSWAINFEITNADQRAYAALLELKPEGASQTLGAQKHDAQTFVCADAAQKHVVLIGPDDAPHHGMAYGDGKQFALVRRYPMLGDGWFFDPRQRNDKHNDDFRGLDLRLFSYVEPNAEKGTCKVECGTRDSELKLLTGPAKDAVLAGASYVRSPHEREAYALARDKAGTYYFVDRGNTPETERDFRLYRGLRGKLKPLAMKDVVSDSEGEIFASTSGKLRLVVGKQSAQWIAGGTSNLLLLPLNENYGLIYNELGVYLKEKLGVPCDDM